MSEHYYTENPASAVKEKNFTCVVRNAALTLTSVSGVFAFGEKVDRASTLLIESFRPSGKTILDLGCGYGAIGLFLKALFREQHVVLSDINRRAVEYAMFNARHNRLDVVILQSNLFSGLGNMMFDDIVSNPPIASGKKLNAELIDQSFLRLNPGGALWLTAFHNKGGSALKDMMKSRFGNAEDVEKSGGVRVYRSVRQT